VIATVSAVKLHYYIITVNKLASANKKRWEYTICIFFVIFVQRRYAVQSSSQKRVIM